MTVLSEILGILVWPVTTIFIVLLLRAPLSELVPTLKKLKYKDLELEFEREANKILSEAERDLPEIPEKPKEETKDNTTEKRDTKSTTILFSRARLEPAIEILESWRSLELDMQKIAMDNNLPSARSVRSLILELESNGFISSEIVKVLLDLAALRNRVAHTNEDIITYKISSAFISSVNRVKSAMKDTKA